MDEAWQEQQEQENESGIDMHDCWHAHHPLNKLQGEQNDQNRSGVYRSKKSFQSSSQGQNEPSIPF